MKSNYFELLNRDKLKIFSDFDGTITLYDTWLEMGDFFIRKKDNWAELINNFEEQKIGARDCFLKECELVEDFNIVEFNRIIDNQRLDPMFLDFMSFCGVNELPFVILSEGMDYYIKRILDNNNLDIPFYSNKLVFSGDMMSIGLDFPYSDSDCAKCGTSKRNIMMNNTADDEISVFIGDGFSDACVVNYADIVFAKKSLASYCWKNNITYHEYQTFGDIKKKLEKFFESKKLKHRQAAKLKRREVFLRG